jgi:hypothetical protein
VLAVQTAQMAAMVFTAKALGKQLQLDILGM